MITIGLADKLVTSDVIMNMRFSVAMTLLPESQNLRTFYWIIGCSFKITKTSGHMTASAKNESTNTLNLGPTYTSVAS
jgi:hypothetical protein